MILLIEPDQKIKKKLCDLTSRERIIGVDSYIQILEMLCKFKNRFDLIIANIHPLNDALSQQTLFKLCDKLHIVVPPILGIYREGDEQIVEDFKKNNGQCKLIKYSEEDEVFPETYIQAIKELYPVLIADIDKAKEIWLEKEKTEESIDPRKWLKEEGFIKVVESDNIESSNGNTGELITSVEEMLVDETAEKIENVDELVDYKKMYFELKKKHEELLKQVTDLTEQI
jgi:hypothetical protein